MQVSFLWGLTAAVTSSATEIKVACVNNIDMIRMADMSNEFSALTGYSVVFTFMSEEQIRAADLANGEFDVVTLGSFESPLMGIEGLLVPLGAHLPPSYDVDDLLPSVRSVLTASDGNLYGLPFYGESSMLLYRSDLIKKFPFNPTWSHVAAAALKIKPLVDFPICLRTNPGWGTNIALLTAMSNSFGGRWFDLSWRAQFNTDEWRDTLNAYNELAKFGPPGATWTFAELLDLFQKGRCGMWLDATVAASAVLDPKRSQVTKSVAFAMAPTSPTPSGSKKSNWLWAWALSVPERSKARSEAIEFTTWATSKRYIKLSTKPFSWPNAPPGCRLSLYQNPEYNKLPFAKITLRSINLADPLDPSVKPVPYQGVQYVNTPEFVAMGNQVGLEVSTLLSSNGTTVDNVLAQAQEIAEATMINSKFFLHLNSFSFSYSFELSNFQYTASGLIPRGR